MQNDDILVVVPHSGIVIPSEIPVETLSEQFADLAKNVDWYTNWLYDFRDILQNRHLVFPYCSVVLEANRHPGIPDDSVPLRDVNGHPVYRTGMEPAPEFRREMAAKYLESFHENIREHIRTGATFLFDGHSTVTAHGVEDNQIDLMNFQHSPLDKGPIRFCPDIIIETYAEELRKRLPDIRITVNASRYYKVYGHVCSAHSVNAFTRTGDRIPAFIQETNERLYKHPDRTPDIIAINRLRRAFAESLEQTLKHIRKEVKSGADL